MPPPRPYWKGYLKLSLVSCPVNLYTATSSGERVAFRQLDKKTGNRLRQQLIDKRREPVEAADKGRGYEVDKGVYVRIEDEELDAIAIESSHTIDIDCFVPNPRSTNAMSTVPTTSSRCDKVGLEAFAVIRDAMRGKEMVGLGRQFSPSESGSSCSSRGIRGCSLRRCVIPTRFEARRAFRRHCRHSHPRGDAGLAEHILDSKAAKFDASRFHDRYKEAIVALINEKKAGLPVAVQRQTPRIVAGTDLMAASVRVSRRTRPRRFSPPRRRLYRR